MFQEIFSSFRNCRGNAILCPCYWFVLSEMLLCVQNKYTYEMEFGLTCIFRVI